MECNQLQIWHQWKMESEEAVVNRLIQFYEEAGYLLERDMPEVEKTKRSS